MTKKYPTRAEAWEKRWGEKGYNFDPPHDAASPTWRTDPITMPAWLRRLLRREGSAHE